jgi:hypothetical protein
MKRKFLILTVKINWFNKIITSSIKRETPKLQKIIPNQKW